jgi:glycosyltransferase involved in cell wall biosynthesis
VLLLSAHDTRGGTTNYIGNLRRRFERDGHKCQSAALYSAFISDPHAFDRVVDRRQKPSLFGYASIVSRFVSLVRRQRPAAILTVMPLANVAAGVAGWFSRAAVICTHHSPHDKNGRVVRMLDMVMGTLGAYDRIVCVSEAVAQSYANHPKSYRDRVSVISNGVPMIKPASTRSETLARLDLPASEPVVFVAGRLAEQKNVLMAIEAIARVEGVRLVFSGDGPLREDMIALAARLGVSDRVHLLGQIERQDLIDLMFHCDAFMQISRFEGQSMALLEAVYAGAPPIVSDIAVQIEVIRLDGSRLAGIACDPADAGDVARAIREMLFDTQRRAAVEQHLAELAPTIRTENQMLDDYSHLVHDSLARRVLPVSVSGQPREQAS